MTDTIPSCVWLAWRPGMGVTSGHLVGHPDYTEFVTRAECDRLVAEAARMTRIKASVLLRLLAKVLDDKGTPKAAEVMRLAVHAVTTMTDSPKPPQGPGQDGDYEYERRRDAMEDGE